MLFAKLCELGLNNTAALIIAVVLSAVFGYFIGGVNFGIILSEKLYKEDVRQKGSGNAGSTNMVRNYGWVPGLLTLAGDLVKTALAVLMGMLMFLERGMFIAGIFCMIGHIFPVYFGFKGGKGVACFGGIIVMTSIKMGQWYIFVILLAIFLIVVIGTRYVSLASIVCAMVYPVLLNRVDSFLMSNVPELQVLQGLEIYAVILGLMVIIQHRDNIGRLLRGEENKISFKKKKKND